MSARFRFPVFHDGRTYFEFDGKLYEKQKHYVFIQDENLRTLDDSPLKEITDRDAIMWIEVANSGPLDLGRALQFKNLVRLEIHGCQLARMAGLDGLPSLLHLDLRWNEIARIEGLPGLPLLEHLDLSGNRIERIENIDSLKHLAHLNLARNRIKKVEGLDGLGSLIYLNLSNNRITNLDKLQPLLDIEQLTIEYNPQGVNVDMQDRRMIELKTLYQSFSDAANVQYLLVLTLDGLPLYSKSFSNVPIDENLVSGFLSAISSFGAEIGNKFSVDASEGTGKKDLEQLSYGQFKIIVNVQEKIRTAVLLLKDASDALKQALDGFTRAFVDRYRETLATWRGQAFPAQEITDLVEAHFKLDLTYGHNVLRGKADAYLQGIKETRDITRAIIEEAAKEPFYDFFMLRELMERLKLAGLDELAVFDGINKLKTLGIIYALNPKIKHVALDYVSLTDAIPTAGKVILKQLHEGKNPKASLRSLEEIDEHYKNVALLEQLSLVTKDMRLTRVGEELGYYFSIFLES